MLTQLMNVQVWVHDQDEALAFYTEKLGLELRDDVTMPEMGNFRWLTVGVPGQDVSITLMAVPGPAAFDEAARQQVQELMAKGAAGALFFATEDCQATYEQQKRAASSFCRSRASSPTASTPASAIRRGTTSA